jgi:MFS family permease
MTSDEAEHLSESVLERNRKNAESAPELRTADSMPQVVASCVINLTVIQAGINMAFSSILIPQLSQPDSDIQIDLDSSSTVASIVTLSIAAGALVCGPLMDKYGRKSVHLRHP